MIKIKSKRIKLFLISLIVCISLSFVIVNGSACCNGPNYWGNIYPGDSSTATKYQHPRQPSEYLVGSSAIPQSAGYDGSHYGTHDWLADAALRSLRNPIKNPFGLNDWTWLMNSEIASNKWPAWNPSYGNDALHHNKIRSYFTFLFATQMPDMRPKSSTPPEDLDHFPKKIDIPQEGEVIKDFPGSMWVGQINYHSFHFRPKELQDGSFQFEPYNSITTSTSAASKVKELGEAAIRCIGNQIKDEEGNYKSAMKPEGAAGWLGAMTHYIADMVVPAHILEQTIDNNFHYYTGYHSWFEKQLGALTKWDKAYKANGGPETNYFSWDIFKISPTIIIIPIRPDFALNSMAWNAIEIAYRNDGNYLHIEYNGNNNEEASKSGLYINNKEHTWDWKEDLELNGRDGSSHKYFYDKVEKILCLATYFIACAMQYCMNEGEEKLKDNQGLNPDYWVTRNPDDIPRQPPDDDPQRKIDDFLDESTTDRFSRLLRSIGMLVTPILIAIASMLRKTFYLIGR